MHTFQKSYGNNSANEAAIEMAGSQDGGYVLAGMAAASGTANHDAMLMKLDKNGVLQWTKTYGGPLEDYFTAVIATSDGGYILGGSLNSNGYNTFTGDAWLVKTDGSGTILWQKKYTDNSNPGHIFGLTQTSDGGYAFVGDFPFEPGSGQWIIMKTDPSGNVQWQKTLGSPSSDDGVGIIEDNHGGSTGLVVTGYNYSTTGFDGDIVKFDLSTGNVLWTKTYDFDNRTNRLGHIDKLSDGFLIRAVNHDGFENANAVSQLLKTDFNGNIVLVREIRVPFSGIQDGRMVAVSDGYIEAISEFPESATSDIHFVKIDLAGNIVWSKKYPRADGQIISTLLVDGDYLVASGTTKSGSYEDVFVIKTDLSGNPGACTSINETSTSRTPSVNVLTSPFTVNSFSNLFTINTTVGTSNTTLPTNVFCIDTCSPPPPSISINSVTVNESVGATVLQVCLSATSSQATTVQYTTANGSALAGSDYTASNGMVTIPAGQTCANVSIPIINDAASESTETFTVNLSSPVNATIGMGTGTVTINDDDQAQYNCNAITFTPGNQSIVINGITAPVATVQVFNSSWATVFTQTYTNSPGTVTVPIAPGTYNVKVTFYTSSWSYICDNSQNVTVANQCPSGMICVFNICPSQSVNLNNAYSIANLPPGTVVSWHTGTPATDANRMTDAQAQNVTTSGTYYAAINISGNNCYSNTIPVNVTITSCNNSVINNSLQVKGEGGMPSGKIAVYPNPFTNSVRVIIQSEKNERGTMVLTNMIGQQLQSKPIQLIRGGNQFVLEGLDKFPSGTYFIKVNSSDGIQTLKLLRQQ
jgi:hypothetical protein